MIKPMLLSMMVISSLSTIPMTKTLITNPAIENIAENIYKNSQFLHEGNVYQFKGKEYRSENEILKELLTKNPITEMPTSSNPDKIVLDYATGKIDQNKVYGTNVKDFVPIARNFYGKTVLPSCQESNNVQGCLPVEKSAVQRAYDSYVNPGLTRIKYSYDNSNFEDSPIEAEISYKNTKFQEPQKTLMYYYNGRYYNALNPDDLDRMKGSMTQAYYYNPEEFDNISESDKNDYELTKPFSSSKKEFADVYINKLKTDLNNFFLKREEEGLIQAKNSSTYKIAIEIGNKSGYFTINNKGSYKVNTSDGYIKVYSKYNGSYKVNKKDELIIEIKGDKTLKNSAEDISNFIKYYKEYNSWDYGLYTSKCTSFLWCKEDEYDYYKKDFKISDNVFSITAKSKPLIGTGYTRTELTKSTVLNDGFQSTGFKINENLPKFLRLPLEKSKKNLSKIIKGREKEFYLKTWLGMPSYLKNDIFDTLKQSLNSNTVPILDDWIYNDNGITNFSIKKSEMEKEKLLENYKSFPKDKKFKLNTVWDVELTYDEWKNKFYYLNDSNFGKVSLENYWFIQQNSKTIFEFSDLMGENIASSINQARQIQFDKETPVLYKKFYLYNPNGELIAEDYNEQAAFNYLKTVIEIKQGYVNKKELVNLEDTFSPFDNLISDGKYNVYKYKFENQELYFNSYQNALDSYKNNINLVAGVSVIYRREYVYTYVSKEIVKNFYWTNDEELNEIAKEIYLLQRGENE